MSSLSKSIVDNAPTIVPIGLSSSTEVELILISVGALFDFFNAAKARSFEYI